MRMNGARLESLSLELWPKKAAGIPIRVESRWAGVDGQAGERGEQGRELGAGGRGRGY